MPAPLSIPPRRGSLVLFFGLAFLVAWPFFFLAGGDPSGPLGTLGGLLGAWAPSVVGLLLSAAYGGRAGLGTLLRRLLLWRVGLRWYLAAILWPVGISISATLLAGLLGSPWPDFANPPVVTVYPLPPQAFQAGFLALLPVVFVVQTLGSSLGEELGWRGFALPRLQASRTALAASLWLGLLWGLWHLPRHWVPGQEFDGWGFLWLVLGLMANAVIYAWLFNGGRGSLLPVILLHTSQALTGLFLSSAGSPPLVFLVTALAALLVMWRAGKELGRPAFVEARVIPA